ncbi:MAG: IS66 family transposase [Verrucomicrobia bacterium]|nr:IS66 family transposase [Verrucomicrobiota bacterium]MCF7707272.1 IS66 family transposase [Verrucomicrobiota bacterium]
MPPRLVLQSKLGPGLAVYILLSRFEIINNPFENEARPSAVGRKRWLFIGHPQAALC